MWIHTYQSLKVAVVPVLSDNYTYLVYDTKTKHTLIIDPGESTPIIAALDQLQWTPSIILCTHHHYDHIGGVHTLQQKYNLPVWGPKGIKEVSFFVKDQERYPWGSDQIKIISLPGHTLDHLAFYFPNNALLFCGDVLFSLGSGRLFEGSPKQMYHSLNKITSLPSETKLFCGHEYTEKNGMFALTVDPENKQLQKKMKEIKEKRKKGIPTIPSTIQDEKETNPFLRVHTPSLKQALSLPIEESNESTFKHLREKKDLF